MVLKIIRYPATALRFPGLTAKFPLSDEVKDHIRNLHDTLDGCDNGLALASTQVSDGTAWSIFVTKDGVSSLPKVAINPSFYPSSKLEKVADVEGCLSIPEMKTYEIERYPIVKMEWQNESGAFEECNFHGLDARIIQHEIDHLNGILIYDKIPKVSQIAVRNEAIRNRKAGR